MRSNVSEKNCTVLFFCNNVVNFRYTYSWTNFISQAYFMFLINQQVLSSSWDRRPFGHSRHGPKIGGCAPFSGGSIPKQHNVAYFRKKWHLDPSNRLATTDMGWKLGVSLFCGGERLAESPSSTMWPGPRPISIQSGILIHPAVWPQ